MAELIRDPRFKSDQIFNEINKQFITLKDKEMKEYNVHLRTVLDTFIDHMKRDPLFNACYRRIAYVGSYYEGLKVGKPEEFDLNVIINLPITYSSLTIVVASEKPGYVKLKAEPDVLPNLRKHVRWSEYRVMDSWFDEKSHLNQNRFRQWFESVVTRALASFDSDGGKYVLKANGIRYLLHHKKSGPAWTLKIDVPGGHTVDVDLVPVLEFTTPPPKPFINRKTTKQNWFTISKPLEGPNNHILWRPSFYERELEILQGVSKQVIRQLKKLRDTQNFKSIASYYIKTLVLQEIEIQGLDFHKLPCTCLFYYMLKKLHEACAKHEIFDFWNPKNNLLSNISLQEMGNISSRLSNIIKAIDKRIATDPYVIAEFILTKEELSDLKVSRATTAMAATSITTNTAPEVQQPPAQDGYLSGLLKSFWGTNNAAPALQ